MGGGIGMGNTCKPMAVSFQCMTKFTTNKKKKKEKLKKKKELLIMHMSWLRLPWWPRWGIESSCNAGDPHLIPGEGNGIPLQYSCLENSMDRGYSPQSHREPCHASVMSCLNESYVMLRWKILILEIQPKCRFCDAS